MIFVGIPAAPASASDASSLQIVVQNPLSSAEPAPGVGVRLVDIPTATQNDPRARSYIVDHLNPGTTIARRIQVQNNTASPQSVTLYAGAAHINNGTFNVENGGATNQLTTWTTLSPPHLEMDPGQQTDVLVTIKVPADAPEAEQYAVVWAEVRSSSPTTNGNVVQVSRVGIRIYLAVSPGNGPPTSFSIDALTAARNAQGNPKVTATVTNTGGRAVDIGGSLTLSNGPGGSSAGPFPVTQGTSIAPHSSARVAVVLDPELPSGPWKATLDIKSGLVTAHASTQITFPQAGQSVTVQPDKAFNPVWIYLGSGLMLIAIALIVWRRRLIHAGQQW